jgi:hypothetical protein
MRDIVMRQLRGVTPEQVWRLPEMTGRQPDQVGEDVLLELERAGFELSRTLTYLVWRLLRPDNPETWGEEPKGLQGFPEAER